jgi:hypothetical protein
MRGSVLGVIERVLAISNGAGAPPVQPTQVYELEAYHADVESVATEIVRSLHEKFPAIHFVHKQAGREISILAGDDEATMIMSIKFQDAPPVIRRFWVYAYYERAADIPRIVAGTVCIAPTAKKEFEVVGNFQYFWQRCDVYVTTSQIPKRTYRVTSREFALQCIQYHSELK